MAKYAELLKEYRTLAKRADQRLVRLEKLAREDKFKGVLQFSYARAQRDIKTWSGENARRFNTAPPKNTMRLKAKIADIKNFLQSETSTKKGIMKVYQKQLSGWNKKMGSNFTWQEFESYYNRGIAQKLQSKYGYTAHRAIAHIKANVKNIKKAIKNHKKIDINVPNDPLLEDVTKDVVKKYRKDLKQLGIDI